MRRNKAVLDTPPPFPHYPRSQGGAVAQLGERLVRNEKVSGSIPLGSTISALV